MAKRAIEYTEIDVTGLSECLAHDAWKEEVKILDDEDLYEHIPIYETHPVQYERKVKEHWASSFNMLRQTFVELIMKFRK